MILSGEKKEEYREIKPYYVTRFWDWLGTINGRHLVTFRNGYGKDVPAFIAMCSITIGTGKEEWGAEKYKQYFILTIHEIVDKRKIVME